MNIVYKMDSSWDSNILDRKESVYEKQTGCFYNGFYNYNL